jgi:hypothetical protein
MLGNSGLNGRSLLMLFTASEKDYYDQEITLNTHDNEKAEKFDFGG